MHMCIQQETPRRVMGDRAHYLADLSKVDLIELLLNQGSIRLPLLWEGLMILLSPKRQKPGNCRSESSQRLLAHQLSMLSKSTYHCAQKQFHKAFGLQAAALPHPPATRADRVSRSAVLRASLLLCLGPHIAAASDQPSRWHSRTARTSREGSSRKP